MMKQLCTGEKWNVPNMVRIVSVFISWKFFRIIWCLLCFLMIYKYFDTRIYKIIFFWSKNPLEVSEEFIRNYNSSQDLEDREKYEVTAHKMLERAKVEYHCNIKYNGKILYIDLPEIRNTSITTSKFLIFLTFYFFF